MGRLIIRKKNENSFTIVSENNVKFPSDQFGYVIKKRNIGNIFKSTLKRNL